MLCVFHTSSGPANGSAVEDATHVVAAVSDDVVAAVSDVVAVVSDGPSTSGGDVLPAEHGM